MAKLRSNSTRRGRGKQNKSLTGSASKTVMKNGVNNAKINPKLKSSPSKIGVDNDVLSLSKGIITRSGRLRKNKIKENLKVMDNILKTELLIEDSLKESPQKLSLSPSSNGNNNNEIGICNQNNTDPILDKNNSESPKRSTRSNMKNSAIDCCNEMVGRIRVARDLFNDNVEKNSKETLHTNKKNQSKEIKTRENLVQMDSELRDDVLNNMKNVLSTDNDKILPNKKSNKRRGRPFKNPVDALINTSIPVPSKEVPKEKNKDDTNNKSKTKQVRLSNGVVLTLSLVQCDHCQKSFSNKASLSRHMFKHFDLRPNRCKHCPRKFRHRATLKLHVAKRHPSIDKPVQYHVCHICDKAFLMIENLELHLSSHIKTENNFKCLFCDKKFSYRLLLVQHEKTHLDTGRFKCYLCEMSYDSRSRLSYHIKTHAKVKDYICQYCGKEFLRMNSIKRHVRVCHAGHKVQCPICFKFLKGHLSEHLRVHDQKRPHACPDCGQRFIQSTQLKVHRRCHTGARPYLCKICERAFGHSNALLLHIRTHTGEKPFPCAMCPMTFSQLPHMKAHMKKIHGKDSAYKCEKCEEFFKFKFEHESHVKICKIGYRELSDEEKIQALVQQEEPAFESALSLSKMRFLLALLLTKIASKDKLKYLGFNKRLIDDLLEESVEAMGHTPCKDTTLSPLKRLKTNIEILLEGTIPKGQMEQFKSEKKTTEDLLILLTDEKKID